MRSFRARGLPRAALWIGAGLVVLATPDARAADSEVERLRKELGQTQQELSESFFPWRSQ